MFNLALKDIKLTDIEAFCREYAEGIRVEYKRELNREIAKTVAAFANTMGGIWVIGVETDPATHMPKFPLAGIDAPTTAGIKDRIINSCVSGIYPAIVPEAAVVPLSNLDRSICVVRVEESLQAPHAIENSTRVYIRTGSQSNPTDFSEIDRIAYFLERRKNAESRRDALLTRAMERSRYYNPTESPLISVIVSPPYPHRPLASKNQLWEIVDNFAGKSDERVAAYLGHGNARRVSEGVAYGHRGAQTDYRYLEINEYGAILFRHNLEKALPQRLSVKPGEADPKFDPAPYHHLYLGHMIRMVGEILYLARAIYEECGYLGNLRTEVIMHNTMNQKLLVSPDVVVEVQRSPKCIERVIQSVDAFSVGELKDGILKITERLIGQLAWAFNYHDGGLAIAVKDILVKEKLIPAS